MLKYILIPLIALAGCSDDPAEPNRVHRKNPVNEGLVVDFQLTDEKGNPTTEFLFGQDVFFEIKVVNQTGEDQFWRGSYHELPFAFCVTAMDTEPRINLGSTLDGSLSSCEPDSGILEWGETVGQNATWLEYPGHLVLPTGEYTACVGFNFRLENITPEVEPIAFTVEPFNPKDEHVYSMFRMPAMGFCPPEGRFLWAHVVKSKFLGVDRYILVGDRVIENRTGAPGCAPERICPITVPITPLLLDGSQQRTLKQLLAEFPSVDPEINHACDPCYFTLYRLGDEIRRVGPCVYGPPEYREHMNDLEQFIESLIPNEAAG